MEQGSEKIKIRIGLIGVALVLVAVFAVFSFALFTIQRVSGIAIPYPEITITLTWAAIGLAVSGYSATRSRRQYHS